ncbi:hypothetical protein SAMN05428989_3532 [Pseudoxanthomonas sp. GM95]|nr:hypothetical protein SAMN05428989_3532 [Pseudoxanthomonas sp. GM95]
MHINLPAGPRPGPSPWQDEDEHPPLPPGAAEPPCPGQAGDPPSHDAEMPRQLA